MPKTHKTNSPSGRQAEQVVKAGAWARRKDDKTTAAHSMTQVSGGWIKRDISSGGLIEAGSDEGISKASKVSRASVREASGKRSAALKRLADR